MVSEQPTQHFSPELGLGTVVNATDVVDALTVGGLLDLSPGVNPDTWASTARRRSAQRNRSSTSSAWTASSSTPQTPRRRGPTFVGASAPELGTESPDREAPTTRAYSSGGFAEDFAACRSGQDRLYVHIFLERREAWVPRPSTAGAGHDRQGRHRPGNISPTRVTQAMLDGAAPGVAHASSETCSLLRHAQVLPRRIIVIQPPFWDPLVPYFRLGISEAGHLHPEKTPVSCDHLQKHTDTDRSQI